MTFEEAKVEARKGIKVTHDYFSDDEYITIKGNIIVFEDGVEIFIDDWIKDKDFFLNGWSLYTT